ncbi:MAG: hypothetical protein INH37_19030, partial [Myxococcaceae bacterium]|nr:hypothetical protein [Myxococcaceae bacterium]
MRVETRVALLGALMGFVVALVPACTRPCSETCKDGCCDSAGKCQVGTEVAACGTGGAMCASCAEGQTCTANACVTPMTAVDAGPQPCTTDAQCANDARGPVCDVASGDCIPKCKNDLECARLMNGSICDLMIGKCAPARVGTRLGGACNDDTECQEGFDS